MSPDVSSVTPLHSMGYENKALQTGSEFRTREIISPTKSSTAIKLSMVYFQSDSVILLWWFFRNYGDVKRTESHMIVDAPWYVPNTVIRRGLQIPTVKKKSAATALNIVLASAHTKMA
jgi:hypothetical protein